MCSLCTDDKAEKAAAEWYHRDVAKRLRRLADSYERLASGSLKPHTDEMKPVEASARGLIRELVEWI